MKVETSFSSNIFTITLSDSITPKKTKNLMTGFIIIIFQRKHWIKCANSKDKLCKLLESTQLTKMSWSHNWLRQKPNSWMQNQSEKLFSVVWSVALPQTWLCILEINKLVILLYHLKWPCKSTVQALSLYKE